MSYWKGLGVAVAIDLVLIMGVPFLATGPEVPPYTIEPRWAMNDNVGAVYVAKSPDVDELQELGRVQDSLMMYLQEHPDDVDAIQKVADVYADNAWWDNAIGPLARALQLDPSRRSLWSALDRAVDRSGKAKITDRELTERAAAFVEAVEMWGHGC
jgi:cytochrome c-type biogenesis protein CcmH/NrfG